MSASVPPAAADQLITSSATAADPLAAIRRQTEQRAWIGPRLQALHDYDRQAEAEATAFRYAVTEGVGYTGHGPDLREWSFDGWGAAMAAAGDAMRSAGMADWCAAQPDGHDEPRRLAAAVFKLAVIRTAAELAKALELVGSDVLNRGMFRARLHDLERAALDEYFVCRKAARRAAFADLIELVPHMFGDVLPAGTEESQPATTTIMPPAGRRKSGRPSDTDHARDRKTAEAWQTNTYPTYADLAAAMGYKKGADARKAVERHKKRTERAAQ